MPKPDQVNDPELRGQIEKAHQQMRSGDGTGAVRTLADAYLAIIEKSPEFLQKKLEMRPGFSIPAVMRWPALGANLTMESVAAGAPKIEFTRERFAVSEAMTYYEYTLESAIGQGL
jgi:hypothetical protein